MENSDYLMASGIAGSLDDAFGGATTNLALWLEKKYRLNAAEVSSVVATSVVYDVAEVANPSGWRGWRRDSIFSCKNEPGEGAKGPAARTPF